MTTDDNFYPRLYDLLEHLEHHAMVILTADDREMAFDGHGIMPLYKLWRTHPEWLRGALVVDRVIGLGSAVLLAEAGVRGFLAPVVSTDAYFYLDQRDIAGVCVNQMAPYIINREGTGRCPLDSLLSKITIPTSDPAYQRAAMAGVEYFVATLPQPKPAAPPVEDDDDE